MKESAMTVFVSLLFVIIVATTGFFTIRWANRVSLQVEVHQVEPNVHCATATSSDGVAISCWRTDR